MVNGPEDLPRLDLDAVDWDSIVWATPAREVERLRQRIFKAVKEEDWPKARNLQKLLLRSRSNTLVSVRQVTQRNAGRMTAGIDGEVALTSEARAGMAVRVHQSIRSWQPRAVRRVYIPKASNSKKLRPARNSCADRPLPSGTDEKRAGTRVGGPVRAPVLWVPAGP